MVGIVRLGRRGDLCAEYLRRRFGRAAARSGLTIARPGSSIRRDLSPTITRCRHDTKSFADGRPGASGARHRRGSCAGPAGPPSRLPCGQDRVQLPGGHLGGQRRRIEPRAGDRSHRAGRVSAVLARRPLDRVLVQPLRQLRRLRRVGDGRRTAPADLSHRERRSGRLDARFAEHHLPRHPRRRRVPERCHAPRGPRPGRA